MATIEKALEVAARAHAGQKDKQGAPYLLHPLRVMNGVHSEEAKIVAVLHDVIEDTSVTIDDIRRAGFSEPVLDALLCVTHKKGESYASYVVRCKGNDLARQVKLADLEDNGRLPRVLFRPARFQGDMARIRRYKFLMDEITEKQYRDLIDS